MARKRKRVRAPAWHKATTYVAPGEVWWVVRVEHCVRVTLEPVRIVKAHGETVHVHTPDGLVTAHPRVTSTAIFYSSYEAAVSEATAVFARMINDLEDAVAELQDRRYALSQLNSLDVKNEFLKLETKARLAFEKAAKSKTKE